MKNKFFPIFLVLTFITIFVIFYKSLNNSKIYTPKIDINKEIPSFSAKLFNSGITVNSLKVFNSDQFYLLNIWSSWCVPCREEHSLLINLSKNKNINVIGLNYKDKKKNAQSFLNELGNPFMQILLDIEGTIALEWGAFGVPESFLIHRGRIIKRYIGPLNKELLEEIKLLIK